MTSDDTHSLHLSIHHTYCPYCSAPIDLVLDPFQVDMEYVEDCSVCCQPMVVFCKATPEGDVVAELLTE